MSMNVGKNCTTIFLLPGIGLHRKDLLQYGFISAYLNDKGHTPYHRDSIYLLFHPNDMDAFQDFLRREYKRTSLLIEDYDYKEGYVVVVYRFPQEFLREYKLFLKGKYSHFSKDYIKLFPTTVKIPGTHEEQYSLQYHIFTRSSQMKEYWENKIGIVLPEDTELWSAPNVELDETLDINEVKLKLLL